MFTAIEEGQWVSCAVEGRELKFVEARMAKRAVLELLEKFRSLRLQRQLLLGMLNAAESIFQRR